MSNIVESKCQYANLINVDMIIWVVTKYALKILTGGVFSGTVAEYGPFTNIGG